MSSRLFHYPFSGSFCMAVFLITPTASTATQYSGRHRAPALSVHVYVQGRPTDGKQRTRRRSVGRLGPPHINHRFMWLTAAAYFGAERYSTAVLSFRVSTANSTAHCSTGQCTAASCAPYFCVYYCKVNENRPYARSSPGRLPRPTSGFLDTTLRGARRTPH